MSKKATLIKDVPKKRMRIKTQDGKYFHTKWEDVDNGQESFDNWHDVTIENVKKKHNLSDEDIASAVCQVQKAEGELYVTEHALDRIRERLGLKRKSALRIATKAFEEGINADDPQFVGTWFYQKQKNEHTHYTYRVWNKYICVFYDKNTLITVFPRDKYDKLRADQERAFQTKWKDIDRMRKKSRLKEREDA